MLIVLEFFILNWYETQSQNKVGDSFSFCVSIISPVFLSILMFFFLNGSLSPHARDRPQNQFSRILVSEIFCNQNKLRQNKVIFNTHTINDVNNMQI